MFQHSPSRIGRQVSGAADVYLHMRYITKACRPELGRWPRGFGFATTP